MMRGFPGHRLADRIGREKLGEILIERNVINNSQLNCALFMQKENEKLLGELLIDLALVTPVQLDEALALQRESRY